MANDSKSLEPASLILSDEQVGQILIEAAGDLGAAGGKIGGAIGGAAAGFAASAGGAAGGGSGGRAGAEFSAKRFNKIQGDSRTLNVPLTPETVEALTSSLGTVGLVSPEDGQVAGVVGSGAMNMNPTVVQGLWQGGQLHLCAHALEGLIKQRTAQKALDKIVEAFGQ